MDEHSSSRRTVMPRIDVMYDPWLTSKTGGIPDDFYRQLAKAVAEVLGYPEYRVRVYPWEVKAPSLARRTMTIDIMASDRQYRELPDPDAVVQGRADTIKEAVYNMLPPEMTGHDQVAVLLWTGRVSSSST